MVQALCYAENCFCYLQESVYASKRRLAEFTGQSEKFLSKYDELKIRQTRDLNPLVYLLAKMADDKELCDYLRETRPPVVATGDRRRELGGEGVKVVDLVEGAEIDLPEKGETFCLSVFRVVLPFAAHLVVWGKWQKNT